jgi:ferredoxin-fold anticodon binding domain-containing protein
MFANKTVILAICSGVTRSLKAGKKINIMHVFSERVHVINLMSVSP